MISKKIYLIMALLILVILSSFKVPKNQILTYKYLITNEPPIDSIKTQNRFDSLINLYSINANTGKYKIIVYTDGYESSGVKTYDFDKDFYLVSYNYIWSGEGYEGIHNHYFNKSKLICINDTLITYTQKPFIDIIKMYNDTGLIKGYEKDDTYIRKGNKRVRGIEISFVDSVDFYEEEKSDIYSLNTDFYGLSYKSEREYYDDKVKLFNLKNHNGGIYDQAGTRYSYQIDTVLLRAISRKEIILK